MYAEDAHVCMYLCMCMYTDEAQQQQIESCTSYSYKIRKTTGYLFRKISTCTSMKIRIHSEKKCRSVSDAALPPPPPLFCHYYRPSSCPVSRNLLHQTQHIIRYAPVYLIPILSSSRRAGWLQRETFGSPRAERATRDTNDTRMGVVHTRQRSRQGGAGGSRRHQNSAERRGM